MSWDGIKIIAENKLVYTGMAAEVVKFYKIDGTWFLILYFCNAL